MTVIHVWIKILQYFWVLCPPSTSQVLSSGFTGFYKTWWFQVFWRSLGKNQQPREEVLPWQLLLGAPCCLLSGGTLWWKHTGIASYQWLKSCLPPCKISPSCATNLYAQILISSNGLSQVTYYFALEHLFSFSFRRKCLRNYGVSWGFMGHIHSGLWHWDNYF